MQIFKNNKIVTVKYREGLIKNGTCHICFGGLTLFGLYVIVDTSGAIFTVQKWGLLSSSRKLLDECKFTLIEALLDEESKVLHPRNLYFNNIDSPIK